MYAIWLDSEITAQEVAWQMRTWRVRNIIFIVQEDYLAFRLALALSRGKVVYSMNLAHSILTIFLLLLVFANLIVQLLFGINHYDDLVFRTEIHD